MATKVAAASKAKKVAPIPKGYHTVTPHLVVKGAAAAMEFYKKAFGAKEICRMSGQDGKTVMHAEMQIGDSMLFLCDEFPTKGAKAPAANNGFSVSIHLYVNDVDATFARAVAAGAKVSMPAADMFWGDRYGKVVDPFGHHWGIATHKEDVPPEEMAERAAKAMSQKK